jgi:hypothetical protein
MAPGETRVPEPGPYQAKKLLHSITYSRDVSHAWATWDLHLLAQGQALLYEYVQSWGWRRPEQAFAKPLADPFINIIAIVQSHYL